MNELALFAGAGGGILGVILLGWRTVCAVEYEPHAVAILAKRQNDGFLQPFPIWDDVCTFDGKPWRGIVDVVSGGFPCQDISVAGKGKGIEGERSGLWGEMRRIVCEVQPRYVFVENSPALTYRGLGMVLRDLASMGYDAKWGVFPASAVGAPHKRERIFIVANSNCFGQNKIIVKNRQPCKTSKDPWGTLELSGTCCGRIRRIPDTSICRVANELATGVDRIARCGNGQVPGVVKLAWEILAG